MFTPFGFMTQVPIEAGTPWTPADLTTEAKCWLDATVGVTDIAGRVSSWADQTSNARNYIQNTDSDRPTTNTITRNGLNVLDFNNNYMSSSNAGIKASIFVVESPGNGNAVTDWITPIHGTDTTSIKDYTFITSNSLDSQYDISIDGANANSGNAGYNGSNPVSGANIDFGNTNAENEAFSLWYTDYDNLIAATYLASINAATEVADRLYFAEILFLDYVPSTSDRQLMEGYLAHRWGLEANLPVGHPYKSAAPTT